MNFVDLKTQYQRIAASIRTRTEKVYEHQQFILGPEVTELEEKLARFVGAKHAVSCANGTDALTISLMAAGVGPGDEVIVPAFSFFATVESPLLVGATPVFADIEADTYLISLKEVEALITPKTKAIIPVSLYGQCPDLVALEQLANSRGIVVIEDAAQSFGATRNGRKSGSFNSYGTTSFFPSKPLGCYGDGGAVFTSDEGIAATLKQIRFHGQSGRYQHARVGLNSRLDTFQAAILLAKMEIFAEEIEMRDRVAKRYTEKLGNLVMTPRVLEGNISAWAQYTIEVNDRDQFAAALKEKGVPTAVHYPSPLHTQVAITEKGIRPRRSLKNSEVASQRVISLPMHPYLSEADQDQVVEAVRLAVKR